MVGKARGLAVACVLALLGVTGALGAASCSLSLDESLLEAPGDDGGHPVDPDVVDAEPTDASDGAVTPSVPDAEAGCTSDKECAPNGCLTGRCDLARKACTYEVCRGACKAGVCDTTAGVCGDEKEYTYKAGQFAVGAPVSCTRCVAAVHSWLFVATPAGAVAFDVSNPTSSNPRQVPIVGLGFIPTHLVKSGDRVWMLGGQTNGPPNRLPIAYVDPPTDPFAEQIVAHNVLATYSRPPETVTVFARGKESLLIVGPSAAQYASAFVEAPIIEPLELTATAAAYPVGSSPVAVSGERLLMYGVSSRQASFTFIDGAGSAVPSTGSTTEITEASQVSSARAFAQSDDGVIFWATGVVEEDDIGTKTGVARGYFLTANETAPIEDASGFDIEVYDAVRISSGASVFGNGSGVAMLDATTAIIATMARENTSQTAVQFVRREPLGVVKEADDTKPRRLVLPTAIGSIVGATASNGIGYIVANDQPGPPTLATVYVFDPGCAL